MNGNICMYWNEIQIFFYDCLSIGNFKKPQFEVFEIADGLRPIRFSESCGRDYQVEEFSNVNILDPKVFIMNSYGLQLSKKDCGELVEVIKHYTHIKPERRSGMF